ncbi:MAG: hypothetical protein O3A96_00065 [Proteobacteria bacterium]|nr:hypothetical protein [Pseudomonadota bacterium]
MTPSASLLHAISGLTAPKPAAPQAAVHQAAATASRPEPETTATRDGTAMPKTFDPAAPRGRYLDIVA